MDFSAQLQLLKDSQGDPAKLALATVDLAYPAMSDSERTVIRESLKAAAIPHWCNARILAALLDIPAEESTRRVAHLRNLNVIESFPARGHDALNVHEATRLAFRQRMAADDTNRFRTLSKRAAMWFADDSTPAGQVEWIYHVLCDNPELGADELQQLHQNWASSARPEDLYALAAALSELEETGLVHGRAQVWILLVDAWNRVDRGEAAGLTDVAARILDLARSTSDARAEADALCLTGDVYESQGHQSKASEAFHQYLEISRQLAEQDLSNVDWQLNRAIAHSRVGERLRADQKLDEAQAEFAESLRIINGLTEKDPNNAGLQRELAAVYGKVGDAFQAQRNLADALKAFQNYLTISRRLADQDPDNAARQSDLALAHNRMGNLLLKNGKPAEAHSEYGEYLSVFRSLAGQDPGNANWQWNLAVAHCTMGDVLRVQGDLAQARSNYAAYLKTIGRLTEQDPNNADWQQELADAQSRLADVDRSDSSQKMPDDRQ